MTTHHAHLDFESASRVDLRKCGTDRYARDPSTRVLMLNYAIDNHPVHLWLPHERPMPAKLRALLLDPATTCVAHNAQFERAIFLHALGIDIPNERWICTQAMAASLALPLGLGELTRDALRFPADTQKDKDGKKLIQMFCKPRSRITENKPWGFDDWNTQPEAWRRFCDYGRQDVVAERKVFKILSGYITDLPEMRRLWCMGQTINERGVPIDMALVRGAQVIAKKTKKILREKMIDVSGLANPNSAPQVLPWLQERGYPYANLRKERVVMALEHERKAMTKDAITFLKLRQHAAKTSNTKYDAIERAVSESGLLRYMFQFRAASRTGRYGGRVVQLQNLPRPHRQVKPYLDDVRQMIRDEDFESLRALFDNPLDVLSSSIRSAIAAPPGHIFTVADLAAIELAVLAWLTNCKFWLDVLRRGLDPYKAFGVHFLDKLYEEITKEERDWCKPGALGSGYRLGGGFLREDKNGDIQKTGLWGYAESMGIKLTQAQSAQATSIYRTISPEVVQAWYDLEAAVLDTIRDKQPRKVLGLVIDIRAPFLRIRLPSGRYLHYCRPKIENRRFQVGTDEDGNPKYKWGLNMTYEAVDQTANKWYRQSTHGGKLIENCLNGETLILTLCGPKRIVDVQTRDKVWDGDQWVSHSGVIDQGVQQTIKFGGGIRVTPDHRIDVGAEWVKAGDTNYAEATSSFGRHYRAPQQHADGDSLCRIERQQVSLGNKVRLRSRETDGCDGVPQRSHQVLRMCGEKVDLRSQHDARNVQASGVLGVAVNERPLHPSDAPSMEELRGPGNFGLSALARIVRELLGRHGRGVSAEAGHRAQEQQRQLQQAELPVGHAQGELAQSSQQQDDRHTERSDAALRGCRTLWDRSHDIAVPAQQRVAGETVVREAGCYEQVFDLLNAGPNKRFTVVGDDGQLVLVHNCVQAIALDVLNYGIEQSEMEGFKTVLHVHDENGTLRRIDDEEHNLEALCEVITRAPPWADGMPLSAAGYDSDFYKKD